MWRKWCCHCCSRRDVLVCGCNVACEDAASACWKATGTAAPAGMRGCEVMMHVCKAHMWCCCCSSMLLLRGSGRSSRNATGVPPRAASLKVMGVLAGGALGASRRMAISHNVGLCLEPSIDAWRRSSTGGNIEKRMLCHGRQPYCEALHATDSSCRRDNQLATAVATAIAMAHQCIAQCRTATC